MVPPAGPTCVYLCVLFCASGGAGIRAVSLSPRRVSPRPQTLPNPRRAVIAGIPSADKALVEVEGGYHEVLFEATGPALVRGMAAWMLERAGGAAAPGGAKM